MEIGLLRLLQGDALAQLRTLDPESVQMCVTSPPYFGLRSYGTDSIVWDNTTECEHEFQGLPDKRNRFGETITLADKQWTNRGTAWPIIPAGSVCQNCGAWAGELGLEPTPEKYSAHLVEIFGQVRRVLKPDGILFLNIGDSYAGSGNGWRKEASTSIPRPWLEDNRPGNSQGRPPAYISSRQSNGAKPKDLYGIPWMLAFALRSDGWYLRSEITWCKRAPMPESVTDRPTSATEKLFLFSKSERYLYNASAVRLSPLAVSSDRLDRAVSSDHKLIDGAPGSRRTDYISRAQIAPISNEDIPAGTRDSTTVGT